MNEHESTERAPDSPWDDGEHVLERADTSGWGFRLGKYVDTGLPEESPRIGLPFGPGYMLGKEWSGGLWRVYDMNAAAGLHHEVREDPMKESKVPGVFLGRIRLVVRRVSEEAL